MPRTDDEEGERWIPPRRNNYGLVPMGVTGNLIAVPQGSRPEMVTDAVKIRLFRASSKNQSQNSHHDKYTVTHTLSRQTQRSYLEHILL